MKERPILFSAPMVRAILEGRKTQTRRAVADRYMPLVLAAALPSLHDACPYGKPGDRLWVREAFSGPYCMESAPPAKWGRSSRLWYWADGNPSEGDWTRPRPSIHMPRWASRITLEIVAVRVERLQDISDDDCLAEGIAQVVRERLPSIQQCGEYDAIDVDPVAEYRALWETINGSGAWDVNPWVFAVGFKVVQP